jgi:phage-related protein
MPIDKFQSFQIRLYSPDGTTSPVEDYIADLLDSNKEFGLDVIAEIGKLPEIMYLGSTKKIKSFKQGDFKCIELRILHKNNLSRLFFVVEEPNFIVLYGFTKKTNKTDKKDIVRGESNLRDYQKNKYSILFDY